MHKHTTTNLRRSIAVTLVVLGTLAAQARAVTMDWRTIGNPGNKPDTVIDMTDHTTGYGSVDHTYKIGTYDVTNTQYAEFLNAKDPTGTNSLFLYKDSMSTDPANGGINFNAANASGSKYTVVADHANYPVTYVTWYSAIRFANWMNNGQGNASTETGAYTLGALGRFAVPVNGGSITRNAGASVFLPSENEWYKAAYYDPATSSYHQFATGTNSQPFLLDGTDAFVGQGLDDKVLQSIDRLVQKQVQPMRTTLTSANYRRIAAAALARRLTASLFAECTA